METKGYRMTLKTYQRFRRHFKAIRNESMADYFRRLSVYLAAEGRSLW